MDPIPKNVGGDLYLKLLFNDLFSFQNPYKEAGALPVRLEAGDIAVPVVGRTLWQFGSIKR
jgi:hypothetical protein